MTIILVFIFVAILSSIHNRKYIHASIITLSYLFSCRSLLVPDTLGYMDMYEYGLDWYENIEIGFLYLCHLCKNYLHFSFQFFLFIMSVFFFESWYYISKSILKGYNISNAFIIFLSFYGIFFFGIVLRSSIAITICFWGIYYLFKTNTKKAIVLYSVLVLFSALFQVGSLLFLLVPFCLRQYSKKTLYLVILFSIFCLFMSNVAFISSLISEFSKVISIGRATGYIENYTEKSALSVLTWLNIFIPFFIVHYNKRIDSDSPSGIHLNLFMNMCVFSTLITCSLNNFDSGARVGMQWAFFEFIPITMLSVQRGVSAGVMILYSSLKFFALIHYYPEILNYSF